MPKSISPYWPLEEFSITDLFLDPKNIRIPNIEIRQDAIIHDLFTNEDAFELVRSYVQNDIFSDEFPIIIKEKGKNIVIEGNRRIAALKALSTPELVPQFEQRIKAFNHPGFDQVRVTIAPNREAAMKHIANKHTINFRRPWKPLRQAYFYKSQMDNGMSLEKLKSEYPDHDISKFIRMLEMHHLAKSIDYEDDAVSLKVHDERKFPITNLERLYEKEQVREFLHIEFDEQDKVYGSIDIKEFKKPYRKIIEDVANGVVDSRKYNTNKQITGYLNQLPEEYVPDASKSGSFGSKDFKEVSVEKIKKEATTKSKRRPAGLFTGSDIPFRLNSAPLRILYTELKDINVRDFPNATHDLLRSFLECALIVFFKETGEFSKIQKNKGHNPTLGELLTFIINGSSPHITDSSIIHTIKQIKTDYDKPYSLERMNMTNHNETWNNTEKDVRSAWSKLEGLMKIILNPPKNASGSK